MPVKSLIQINIEVILIVLCVGFLFITFISERNNRKVFKIIWSIDVLTAGLLITDILAIYYRGDISTKGFYMVRAANFANFIFLHLLVFVLSYLVDRILDHPANGKKRIFISKLSAGIAMFIDVINLFIPITYDFDEHNKYFRLGGWYLIAACLLISIVLLSSTVISNRKYIDDIVLYMLLGDILMPLIASVVQIFIYGISITNIAIGMTQILLFFILYWDQVKRIKEKDIKIEEYNAKLMLTQVQPHFMLNTLSTIQYLCKTDSDAAYETISDFGVYLRNNMEFASSVNPISFERELSHIEKYVSIEQKRFGERIKVKYNIKEKDFEIPALSIQPLVENAIKHGISKKREGGTVEISTWRGADDIHVLISDDGKGYDMNQPFSTDRVHLGIAMVGSRLKRMCGGELKMSSEPGKGTICEIIIPIAFIE